VITEADAVKIDAEGSEVEVLEGLTRLISEKSPLFLIENNDFAGVTAFLANHGYKPFMFSGKQAKLVPFEGVHTNCFYLSSGHLADYT
jgi:hypothetical protein